MNEWARTLTVGVAVAVAVMLAACGAWAGQRHLRAWRWTRVERWFWAQYSLMSCPAKRRTLAVVRGRSAVGRLRDANELDRAMLSELTTYRRQLQAQGIVDFTHYEESLRSVLNHSRPPAPRVRPRLYCVKSRN